MTPRASLQRLPQPGSHVPKPTRLHGTHAKWRLCESPLPFSCLSVGWWRALVCPCQLEMSPTPCVLIDDLQSCRAMKPLLMPGIQDQKEEAEFRRSHGTRESVEVRTSQIGCSTHRGLQAFKGVPLHVCLGGMGPLDVCHLDASPEGRSACPEIRRGGWHTDCFTHVAP